jgi:hypothetical protein
MIWGAISSTGERKLEFVYENINSESYIDIL